MRKYEPVEKVVKEYQVKSVSCNKCGKTKELDRDEYKGMWQLEEFQAFHCNFGYGSKYDEEQWKFDLCEACLEELINTFKIKPEGYHK
ncbi:hypothetical protein D1B33_14830 [Lysinibacillus yapensis]|uniref:Uncharacterized protein n=1 Tax=Ureibacillus yapensis TaxID=2304605 RepID=A0A396S4J6_9BACL|nr:hypothetical protein [Lysinibacillus yapensis]RHW34069.1 hypothetical protein D1B33_14830 [Lysinibacillus yapensis]